MGLPMYPKSGTYQSTHLPPFPFSNTKKQTDIDLREEMRLILEGSTVSPRRGHWVLVRRMDRRQRCFCWNRNKDGKDKGKYNEAELRCPVCNGEGWVYEDELHLTRRTLVSPAIGLAGSEQLTDMGWANINYIVFYFQHYIDLEKGDKIIEIDLDDDANPIRPFKYREMYRIAVAEPFRDQNGRIEFWRAACKLEIV